MDGPWSSLHSRQAYRHGRKILAALFLTGITLVALEDVIRLDKSAIMLVLASVMWTYHVSWYSDSGYPGDPLAFRAEDGT